MNTGPVLVFWALWLLAVAGMLSGLAVVRNPRFHEKGHAALSCFPGLHVLGSCAVAWYVRTGFGAWPRSCVDNPDLPFLDGLVLALVLGLLVVVLFVPPVWLGWWVVRWRRGAKQGLMMASLLFITGLAAVVALQWTDPGGFWAWVWD